jgi:hypothetical protein
MIGEELYRRPTVFIESQTIHLTNLRKEQGTGLVSREFELVQGPHPNRRRTHPQGVHHTVRSTSSNNTKAERSRITIVTHHCPLVTRQCLDQLHSLRLVATMIVHRRWFKIQDRSELGLG